MAALTHTLDNIEKSVRLLKTKLDKLERDNAVLTEQNQRFLAQNRALQTDLLMNESELSYLKTQLKTQEEQEPEAQERQEHLRKEINPYVSELDERLEWLQK